MVKTIDNLLKEKEQLILEKDELIKKLDEANEVIDGIRTGNIDAVLITNHEMAKVLVSKTADLAYRRFIENMSEGVVTLHTGGIILYGNASFAKLVNLPLETVIGKNIQSFIPVQYIDDFGRFLIDQPQNNSKFDLSIFNPAGNYTYFIVSLNILQLQDFHATNLVWTDVTDQKKTEGKLRAANENLREANIELSAFAHIASHDLQEPLRKIMTYSDLLKSDYHNNIDSQGQNYLNKIRNGSLRMRNLINDILDYSEISQKDSVFEFTDLHALIKDILSDLEIVINETKAEITIKKDLPFITGNRSQLRQLFQNILSNSLKFIAPGNKPQITIAYEIKKGKDIHQLEGKKSNIDFYEFQIRDNGIGFNPEYLNKIFTIFQKLNNNSIYPGTGIGLAICKKVVEKHYGFITAESELGEGALFTITLPVSQNIPIKEKKKTIPV